VSSTEFHRVTDELMKAKLKVWTMAEGMVMQDIVEEAPVVRPLEGVTMSAELRSCLDPPARPIRRHPNQLDVGALGQGGRDRQ
jgi:hypothetical protein